MPSITQTNSTMLNGVDVDRLEQTVNLIRNESSLANFQFRINNKWVGGGHTQSAVKTFFGAGQDHAHARPFELQADEPDILLGSDLSANPGEYLLHALAACVTSAMVYHAAARGISIETIESYIDGDIDLRGFLALDPNVRNGFQEIRIAFKIKANVPEDQLQSLCDLGPRFSPVFDCLSNGLPIKVSAVSMR